MIISKYDANKNDNSIDGAVKVIKDKRFFIDHKD
jgi:hypothetical protein